MRFQEPPRSILKDVFWVLGTKFKFTARRFLQFAKTPLTESFLCHRFPLSWVWDSEVNLPLGLGTVPFPLQLVLEVGWGSRQRAPGSPGAHDGADR